MPHSIVGVERDLQSGLDPGAFSRNLEFLKAHIPEILLRVSAVLKVSSITFGIFLFSAKNQVLDVDTAFVSLSLFNLLRVPMNFVPNAISNMVQVEPNNFLKNQTKILNFLLIHQNKLYVSLNRLNDFFLLEENDEQVVYHVFVPGALSFSGVIMYLLF